MTLIAAVWLPWVAGAAEEKSPNDFRIGGETIVIPPPPDYYRIDDANPTLEKILKSIVPPMNRLVAFYGNRSDAQVAKGGGMPTMERTLNVQVLKDAETRTAGTRELKIVKDGIQKELEKVKDKVSKLMDDMSKSASRSLSKSLQMSVDFRVGEMVSLGIFENTDNSLGFSALVKARLSVSGAEEEIVQVISACVMVVKGKVLFIYANTTYQGEPDLAWTRAIVKHWRDDILKANPGGATMAARGNVGIFAGMEEQLKKALGFEAWQIFVGLGLFFFAILLMAAVAIAANRSSD
jgi:hypothetical protein